MGASVICTLHQQLSLRMISGNAPALYGPTEGVLTCRAGCADQGDGGCIIFESEHWKLKFQRRWKFQ